MESQPEVDSLSEVGERRRVDLCDSAQPWAIPPACRSSEVPGPACSIDAATFWGEFGELRLDGAEAVVGPVVVGVPLLPFVQSRAELVNAALAPRELGFGVRDVVGEAIDLVC